MDNEKKKYCPIIVPNGAGRFQLCFKNDCQFWTFMYSTENIQIWDCCFVLNAMKNSDGKVPV